MIIRLSHISIIHTWGIHYIPHIGLYDVSKNGVLRLNLISTTTIVQEIKLLKVRKKFDWLSNNKHQTWNYIFNNAKYIMKLSCKRNFSNTTATRQEWSIVDFVQGTLQYVYLYPTGVHRDLYTYGIGGRDEVVDLTQFRSRLYYIDVYNIRGMRTTITVNHWSYT